MQKQLAQECCPANQLPTPTRRKTPAAHAARLDADIGHIGEDGPRLPESKRRSARRPPGISESLRAARPPHARAGGHERRLISPVAGKDSHVGSHFCQSVRCGAVASYAVSGQPCTFVASVSSPAESQGSIAVFCFNKPPRRCAKRARAKSAKFEYRQHCRGDPVPPIRYKTSQWAARVGRVF